MVGAVSEKSITRQPARCVRRDKPSRRNPAASLGVALVTNFLPLRIQRTSRMGEVGVQIGHFG